MLDIFKMKLNNIDKRRADVSKGLIHQSSNIKSGDINTISTKDLQLLFRLYDQIFFENWFQNCFTGKLIFSLSRRLTKSAGLTLCPKNIEIIQPEELVIEIRISVNLLFNYGMLEGNKLVGGILTGNNLEALQLIFEHELCHVIEFIYYHKSNCSQERFKSLARNIFGHITSTHKLPTSKQIAAQNLGLNIGDTVFFDFEGKRLTGILYRINKRATVMVKNKNGHLTDKKGNRYIKYYVPLLLLEGLKE